MLETTATRRTMLGLGAAAGVAATLATTATATVARAAEPAMPKTSLTADQALKRLMDANAAFVSDRDVRLDLKASRRLALARGQAPFAALVGCADSRVGPELLFGAGLGELFIIRTAGNYVDDAGFGSLAYAVGVLGVPLIVVLGHERCGAVDAATKLVTDNAQLPPSLTRMVQPILPAVIDARAGSAGGDLVDRAIRMNVKHVTDGLRKSTDPLLATPIAAGTVKVVGAYYDLDTGRVDFFDRG